MEEKYLYGASCQGIQSFIFETDKLREIVGGSELIEQLCTTFFDSFLERNQINSFKKITGAAGNIRIVFFNQQDVEKVVRKLTINIAEFAPGVIISQSVIQFSGDLTKSSIDSLERKLKIQRNYPQRPFNLGFMSTQRCRRTGRPAIIGGKDGMLDAALAKKQKASRGGKHTLLKKMIPDELDNKINCIPYKMEEMVDREKSGWLAVVHADGNNLGMIIQSIARSIEKDTAKSVINAYRKFSHNLDKATVEAAKNSFGKIILKDDFINNSGRFPIRPIVIGGDDLTVICRADLAVEFTRQFLVEFQKQTKESLLELANEYELEELENGLTACGGIAFVKPKYPFHYAVDLAEELCGIAKAASKKVALIKTSSTVPSSLAFHKIRSTFFDSFAETTLREAMAGEISLRFGPYAIDEEEPGGMPTVTELLQRVDKLRDENSPASSLRQWLSVLCRNKDEAQQYLQRIKDISPDFASKLNLDNAVTENNKTPVADWLSLLSLEKGA